MASGTNLLIGIGAVVIGLYAYGQGWLCKLNIPQLCPGSSDAAAQPYINPQTHISGFPDSGPMAGGYIPPGSDHIYYHPGHHTGYGDGDYDFESNAAVISIA